jgi:hypothetical protein
MADKVTADDLKLLKAFHELKVEVKPKVEKTEDLLSFIKHYGAELNKDEASGATPKTIISHQFPKISQFYGEPGKGEVSFLTWRYEVRCLQEETYTEEQILLGIRRSCKGSAADILRRMGVHATLKDVLKKLKVYMETLNHKRVY